jgi:hypothetical protein
VAMIWVTYGWTKKNGSKEIFPNIEDSMGLSRERESRQGAILW